MTLINSITRADGSVLRTYKSARNGNITHVLRFDIAGKGISSKAVKCDPQGNPYKVVDAAKNRLDVYTKAEDGSTVLTSKGKKVSFPNLVFNTVCEKIFGK